jgi:hypothetical protein
MIGSRGDMFESRGSRCKLGGTAMQAGGESVFGGGGRRGQDFGILGLNRIVLRAHAETRRRRLRDDEMGTDGDRGSGSSYAAVRRVAVPWGTIWRVLKSGDVASGALRPGWELEPLE